MLFPTAEYAFFFLCVFAIAWALNTRARAHKTFLLVASYAFYGFWDWRFVPLLAFVSLAAVAFGRALQVVERPDLRKALLATGVTLSLSVLACFKYLAFAMAGALHVLEVFDVALDVHPVELALPVGISFFVFHAISLMVDAYRGALASRIGEVDGLLYVAFFPQLVAGPILQANQFLPQLAAPPSPERIDASRAMALIASGLVKKLLIANTLSTHLVDPVFASPGEHSGGEVWLAVYGYAAQIYCDFSGYTDLALGSALLLGYRLPENFNAPYLAQSPQEFWRRWHMSLSSWLRNYLYIPLGGSQRGPARTVLALWVTMVLGGLWHGAAMTFVAWGALHGAGLIVHRAWASSTWAWVARVRRSKAWGLIAWALTFQFVCAAWVLFRAPTLEVAGELYTAMAHGFEWGSAITALTVLATLAGLGLQALDSDPSVRLRAAFARLPLTVQGALFALALLVIDALGPEGVAPFIYFQF